MNRLWVRLSVAFSAIIITGVIVIIGTLVASDSFPGLLRVAVYDSIQGEDGLINQLVNWYKEKDNWDDIGTLVESVAENFRFDGIPVDIIIVDSSNQEIYKTTENIVPSQQATSGLPVVVEGNTVATVFLEFSNRSQFRTSESLQRVLLQQIQRVVVIVLMVGAVVGILMGVWISRYLTRPLQELANFAQIIRDKGISQRVKIEQSTVEIDKLTMAFNEMLDVLERSEHLRRNLIADVAHELRTPLSVLQGNLYAIIDDVYPVDKEQILRLYDQTRILSRLISDLHELAQAEAKQLTLKQTSVDARLLLAQIYQNFDPIANEKSIKLRSQIADSLPTIRIDRVRIEQVLHNLLNNALIHTPSGGTITLIASATTDEMTIQVSDTGKGIPIEELNNIFERFYRLDRNRTRSSGSTGLGLAIAKAIVTLHDGKIYAESTGIPGGGTIFTLKLPIKSVPIASDIPILETKE